jgi:haloalkane dehalogenase
LRLAAEKPGRFSRVVTANTGLPTGDAALSEAFMTWRKYSLEVSDFDVGAIVGMGCRTALAPDVIAAYNAPFPDDSYKEGARIFPSLVPVTPDDPAAEANRLAWKSLSKFEKPFVTMFSDGDPITRGGERVFQGRIPGAKGQSHFTIKGAGHFLQEDRGEEFAERVVAFVSQS